MAEISTNKNSKWYIDPLQHRMFQVFSGVLLASSFLGIILDEYLLFGIPAALLLGFLVLVDFRAVFYLLFFLIPFSSEFTLPNGFQTDLPSEPLTVGLMFIYLLYSIRYYRQSRWEFLKHPVSILLLLHLTWILMTAVLSTDIFVSFKFLLAKMWYIVTFFYLAGSILTTPKRVKWFFWCVFSGLLITVIFVTIQHATYGFAFKDVNKAVVPFYRNHVSYASIMSIFFPFIWLARRWYSRYSNGWWILVIGTLIVLLAIQVSYTRAAYIGLFAAAGAYYVVKYRFTRLVVLGAGFGAIVMAFYFFSNNTYLDYAPDFEKTVTHYEFDNLLAATAKGEDISTMERVYRWVAGFHMVRDHPMFGVGPGNFYNNYHKYTVSAFATYVSDNPDRSGIHCYYFMVLVEQGFLGALIFIVLCAWILLLGERVYHSYSDAETRNVIMMTLLSLISILVILIVNDMIETDKVGSFFFVYLAILVNFDLALGKSSSEEEIVGV